MASQLNPSFPRCPPRESGSSIRALLACVNPAWGCRPGHPGTVPMTSRWEFLWHGSGFCPGPDLALRRSGSLWSRPSRWEWQSPCLSTEPRLGLLSPWRCGAEGNSCPFVQEEGLQPSLRAPRYPLLWGTGWAHCRREPKGKNLALGPNSSFVLHHGGFF